MRLAAPGTALSLALLAACQTDERTPVPGTSASPPAQVDATTPLPSPLPAVAANVNGQPIPTRNVRISAEQAIARGVLAADQRVQAYRQATQNLIDRELLTADERAQLDAYHARVREVVGPLVEPEVKSWLTDVTAPI